jgi:hypothetical protein
MGSEEFRHKIFKKSDENLLKFEFVQGKSIEVGQ